MSIALRFLLILLMSVLSLTADAKGVITIAQEFDKLDSEEKVRQLYFQFGQNSQLIDHADSSQIFLDFLEENHSSDHLFKEHLSYFRLLGPLINEKDAQTKIDILKKNLNHTPISSKKLYYAMHLHAIGLYNYVQENYSEAFEYMIQANEIFVAYGYEKIPHIGIYLHDLALCNFKFKNYEKSKELMLVSLNLPAFSPNLDVQRYNTLALSYMYLDQDDSAVDYFYRTLQVSQSYNDTAWMGIAHSGLGQYFERNDVYDSSMYHHKKAYEYYRRTKEIDLNFQSLLSIIHLNIKLGHMKEARELMKPFLNNSTNIPENWGDNYFYNKQIHENSKYIYFQTLMEYYDEIGDNYNAKQYTDSFYLLKNAIDSKYASNIRKISEINLALSENKREIEMYEANKKINTFITVLLSALLAILILSVLIIKSRKKKIEVEHKLKEQELYYKIQAQKDQLRNAQEELKSYLHTLSQKNNLIETITHELGELKGHHHDSSEFNDIDVTINKLKDYRILTEEDWTNFQNLYQKVNNSLYATLRNYKPALTESEIRYLLLISLGLNRKEIASMLGISPDSLRVTWNRLKKKLPEQYDSSPQEFLENLL